uniref:Uncharacterized protein n=1 Tax=Chloropicon laureae TaxID=464258 RepID=A0A7S3E3L1_9CHLO|mmetsp:Transcript_6043/g.15579  ORF Transcript_6043/g.15579 Transcript_6043/m.15579 type:complete len:233 (+) Transcript_6043:319-1017(+)
MKLNMSLIAMAVLACLMSSTQVAEANTRRSLLDHHRYPQSLLNLSPKFFDPVGQCNLDEYEGTLETEWFVPLENLVTYPCSKGYLSNLGANTQLLKDLKNDISKQGWDMGTAKKCGDKCDIVNNLVVSGDLLEETFHQRSFLSLLQSKPRYSEELFYFCNNDPNKGPLGVLNQLWDAKKDPVEQPRGNRNACECGQFMVEGKMVDFEYGCSKCIGEVNYKVKKCYDYEPSSK